MAPRVPQLKPHPLRRLRGMLAAGAVTANAGILYEIVPVFGLAVLTVRAKAVTAAGTLDVILLGPDFEPDQTVAFASLVGTQYTTGNPTQVALVAGTENKIEVTIRGESYALIKFTGGGTGTIGYVDVTSTKENVGTAAVSDPSAVAAAAVLGTTAGAAVVTDANGTIQQYLRGLVKRWADALGAGTAAAALRTTIASDDPLLAQVRIAAPTVNSSIATASAANAVLADTGALAAGTYLIEATAGISGDALDGKHLIVEHRNAANDTTLHTLGLCPAGGSMQWSFQRVVIAATERIRVKVGGVAIAAGEDAQAAVRAHLVG